MVYDAMGEKPRGVGRHEGGDIRLFRPQGQEELDAMWEWGEMTQERLKSFETLHERTPYRR